MRSFYTGVLTLLTLLTGGCQQANQAVTPGQPVTAAVDQTPFRLQLQFLPQHYLSAAHAASADSASPTATFRLRLTSLPDQPLVGELLRRAAPPAWTSSQLQLALLYQLDGVASLTVNDRQYPTILATTETAVDANQAVNLVFVFAVPERVLRRAGPVQIKLTNAFFLTAPLTFTLPLAAS